MLAIVAACTLMPGCGGKSSSTTTTTNTVTIALLPSSATLTTGTAEQFTATVTNATNTGVTYQVNNVTGGSATTGTINTSGLYTAPTQVPNPSTVEIEAISQQDSSVKAVASVTIVAPAPNTHIDISPPSATVPAGAQQGFSAAINGQPANVTWTINCSAASPAACGTITQAGIYTAPTSPPPGGNVSVTATVTSGNTPPANASITVQFSNGTLVGQYAFTALGTGTAMAGSFTANGNGGITGGTGDLNNNGVVSAFTVNASTYSINPDGRGAITLATTAGTLTFAVSLVNHSHAYVARFDNGSAPATGTLDLQDPSKFSGGTQAALTGNYTVAFSNHGGNFSGAVAEAGAFTTNGSGAVSNGKLDVSSGASSQLNLSLAGSIGAPNANSGRGTLAFTSSAGTQNFAYYIIDGAHVKLIELDGSPVAAGDMVQQGSGPFTSANFNGSFASTLLGFATSGALSEGAVFSLDGSGNVKSGAFDINQNGNVQNNTTLTGSYNVADSVTGRTTLSLTAGGTTYHYVAYPEASGALNLLEFDSTNTTNIAGGTAYPQQSSAFSNAALTGNFAIAASGTTLLSNSEVDLVGKWLPNGGTTFSGALDVNDNGTTSRGAQNSVSGSYLIALANGRAQGGNLQASNFSTATINVYVVDANTVLFVEQDGSRALTGIMQKQY